MVKPAGEARRIFTSLENSQTAATTNASDAFSLRSAVLDLCYSEGWTYDKTTQEKLISHLADYFPPPDLWTHQFIREQYEEFRGSNSCSGLSWCSRPYNYRRLWILENLLTVHVTGGERPDWRTFLQHSNALGNQSIILLEEGNAAGGLSDENARILDQTLRELQPQWFPYSKVEVVRGHVTAFIQRYGVHAPFTPGFILQVIQDMEDEGFLTTCYKRGKLLELLSKLKNRRDTRIIGTLIKIISNQASQQEHHKQVTDPVAKEMLHTLGYQFLNEQYRILSSDEDAVGDDLTNDTIERLKAIKEARDTSISKSDPRYTGAECSFLRIIYDLLSLNEVTVMLQSPHRLMFHDSNSRCPEKFGVSRFCMVGEVLCDRYGFKACPKEGKFWVFRHHASLDRKEDILSLKSVAKATTAKKAIVATKTPVLIRDFLRILFEMADKSDENHVVFDEGKLYLHGVRADFENNVFPHYFSSGQQPKYRDFLKNLGRFGFAYLKKTTSFSVFRHESVKRPGDILKLRASTSRNSPNNASPKSSGSNANPSSSPNKSTSPDTEAAKRAALSDNKTRSIPPSKKAKKTCAKTAVAVATTTTAIQADKTWLEKMHEMLLNENQAFSFIPRNGHQPAQLIINWDPDKITKLLPKYFTTGTPSNDAFRQQLRHYGFTVVLRHDQKVTLENPNVEKLDDVCILKRRRRASAPFLQLQVQSPRAQRGTQKSDANERNGDTREHTATVENMESALAQNIVSTVKKVPEKQNKGAEESNDIGQTASEPTDKITTTQSPPPEPQKVLTPRAYTNDSSKFVTKLVDLLAMDETAISFQEGSNDNHGCIIMHDKAKVEKLVWSVFKFKRYGTFVKVLNKYRFYAIMGYGSSSNAMYANTNVKKLDDIIRMNGLEPKTEDNTGKRKRKPRRHFDEIEESMASKKLKTVVLQEVKTSQFPSKPPPHVREVGARVYAEFVTDELHPDDRWFFGTIYQVNKDTKIRTYDVLFDDGDTSEGLFANQVCTERDYSEKYRFGVAMPELTEDRKKELAKLVREGGDGNDSVPQNKGSEKQMSLEQLFKSRCNKCRMCKMKDCGRCATCLYNQDNPEVERRVCYWKVSVVFVFRTPFLCMQPTEQLLDVFED